MWFSRKFEHLLIMYGADMCIGRVNINALQTLLPVMSLCRGLPVFKINKSKPIVFFQVSHASYFVTKL